MSRAIPKGSIVLVTGVNGYIGSHTADQLLSFGYKVRGTVRDASRCQWVQKFFDEKYGKGRLEIAVVAQISADGAFDEAVKGVSGIVHVASDVSFSPNPNVVVPQTIASMVGILNSAIKEPSVKRVVYTSSSSAASPTIPNIPFEVTVDSWNDEASEIAWAPPKYTPDRAFAAYAASKLGFEKACWKFMEEKKPAFEFNTVLPSGNFGPALGEGQSSPSFVAIRTLIQGDLETARKYGVTPQYFVDVRDTARFHVIALTNLAVRSERILAYAEPYNWSKILDILRKAYPTRNWPDNISDEPKDLCTLTKARSRAKELLQELGGKDFITLKESINDCAHITLGSA